MWRTLTEPGHIGIYGGTVSGKTYYMKYIISELLSAGKYLPNEVYVFTTSEYQWSEYENLYTEWEKIIQVKNNIIASPNKRGLIILDDFNQSIPGGTANNKDYTTLFNRGRHVGIRIITVGHKPTDLSKTARESLLYAITGFSSNIEYVNELAKYYFMNQMGQLKNLLIEAQQKGKYTMLVINKRTLDTSLDKAPSNAITPYTNEGVSANTPGEISPANTGNLGVINNKSCVNDNSKNMVNYNINNQVEIQQIINRNEVNNKLSEINYKHNLKMKRMREKEECKELCLKFSKSDEEVKRQIHLLNKFCQLSCINTFNMEKYAKLFMNHYYPDVSYGTSASSRAVKNIGNNYSLIKNIGESNYTPIAQSAIEYFGPSIGRFFE